MKLKFTVQLFSFNSLNSSILCVHGFKEKSNFIILVNMPEEAIEYLWVGFGEG